VAITVFNEGAGLFHAGSGGKGIAPGDVCLTPPPPPGGPVPVPYVNSLSAADLADGSQSVVIDGSPTALEDHSYVSTSTGNEAATQGGSVITHKTKGKGYFTMWSFTLMIEGKGAARHGDPMGQNSASSPPGCVDLKALVSYAVSVSEIKPCTKKYNRKALRLQACKPEQYAAVAGGPCWECARDLPNGDYNSIKMASGKIKAKTIAYTSGRSDSKQFTPDHQPHLNIAWYLGGCHDEKAFKEWANLPSTVRPHCADHSNSQGPTVGKITRGGGVKAFQAIEKLLPPYVP